VITATEAAPQDSVDPDKIHRRLVVHSVAGQTGHHVISRFKCVKAPQIGQADSADGITP
jgi:hypothetical protein